MRPTDDRLSIGIDAHAIGSRQTGNERVFASVIPELREICDHQLHLFFTDRDAAAAWEGIENTTVETLRLSHPLVRIPVILPRRVRELDLDVLLVQYVVPPRIPCPVVTYVHDVSFAVHPEFFPPLERYWMPRVIPGSMRRADSVITVSEFSKTEIARLYPFAAHKTVVAYNGVDAQFFGQPSPSDPNEAPYFLAIGNLQPRKNLGTLIHAFRLLVERRADLTHRLLVVGADRYGAESLREHSADLEQYGRLVFMGYVPDAELVPLLCGAEALAYPSVYEGFGLPVIEAMAAGVPALVSDIPVMREVAGDSALFSTPRDPEAWCSALERVATDHDDRQRLVQLGRTRAARFTWRKTAHAVLSVLERSVRCAPHA